MFWKSFSTAKAHPERYAYKLADIWYNKGMFNETTALLPEQKNTKSPKDKLNSFEPSLKHEKNDLDHEARKIAEEICKHYNEVFYTRKIDREEIVKIFTNAIDKKLADAERSAEHGKVNRRIREILDGIKSEQAAQLSFISDFKDIAHKINNLCKEIDDERLKILAADEAQYWKSVGKKKPKENYDEDGMTQEEKEEIFQLELQRGKYDSVRIRAEIENLKELMTFSERMDHVQLGLKNNWSPEELEYIEKNKTKGMTRDEEKYASLLQKLEILLRYQENLEIKSEEVIFGHESAELVAALFRKYREIMKSTDEIKATIPDHLKNKHKVSQTDLSKITLELINRADNILNEYYAGTKNKDERKLSNLLEEIGKIRADALTFKSIFRVIATEHPEISFKYFKDLDFRIIESKEIMEKDKAEMFAITEKNYPDLDERRIALDGLESGFENKNTVLEILRHQGKIISFLRFDRVYEQNGGDFRASSYFGSFNTDPDFQEASIGEAMLRECLEEEAQLHPIEAHTLPDKKITSKYIEETGFVITDIKLDYAGSGKTLFKITRDDRINKSYSFRNTLDEASRDFIVREATRGSLPDYRQPFALQISPEKLRQEAFLEKLRNIMVKHDLAITRFFPDDKDHPHRYFLTLESMLPEPEPSAYII